MLGLLSAGRALGGPLSAWVTEGSIEQIFLIDISAAIGFLIATFLVGRFAFRFSAADLRWKAAGRRIRNSVAAFLAGTGLAALVMIMGLFVGGARWVSDAGNVAGYAERIGFALLILLPGAFAEELIFRGLPLVALDRTVGRGLAIGITSLLFALAHGTNPSVTTLSIGNICVAGVLLGVVFFAPGGLWTATGLHLGWNWGLAALDAPVSGINLRIPLIDYHPGQPGWLTGGAFGPEGGVLATLVLAAATIVAGRLFLAHADTAASAKSQ